MAIFLSGRKRYQPPPLLCLLLHHTARLQEWSTLGEGNLLFLVGQSRAQQGKALSSQQSSLPRISLLNTALSETSFCSLKQSGINSVNIKFQARIRAQTPGDVSNRSSHNRVTWPCSCHVRGLPKGQGLRLCTHHPGATPHTKGQEKGDAETCLSSRMEVKGCASASKRRRLREDPDPAASAVCKEHEKHSKV